MRIYCDYNLNAESGKTKFLNRLQKEWDRTGVSWSYDPDGCDVRLCVSRPRTNIDMPSVVRIDGNLTTHKHEISHAVRNFDLVIWQSEFCRKMGRQIFGIPKKECVVFNGASPDEFDARRPDGVSIVMSAKWKTRENKRLKRMLDLAVEYLGLHSELRFRVLGNIVVNVPRHPRIKYYGEVSNSKVKEIYSKSSCMLNLAWYDWCPNAVVEALVAGLPVICSGGTGVGEVVGDSGIVLDLDAPIERAEQLEEHPPKINYQKVFDALDRVMYGKEKFPKAEHLNIQKIAIEYKEALNGVTK